MTSLEYAGPNNNAPGKRLGAAIVSQAEVASEIAFSWSSGLGWPQDWQRHQQGVQVQSRPEAVIPSALPVPLPKGPKYLYGTKYGFCSSNFHYGLGKYSLYWYLGPLGSEQSKSPSHAALRRAPRWICVAGGTWPVKYSFVLTRAHCAYEVP